MKRVVTILWLLLVSCFQSFGQLYAIRGELRYEHQYQDVLSRDFLFTSLRRSPSVNLSTSGSFISKRILFYTVRTSLNASYNTSHSGGGTFKGTQYLWNLYDVNLMFLQSSPINFSIGAREHTMKSKYAYGWLNTMGGTRQQEQRINLSLQRISFLPVTTFMYQRTRSWSVYGMPSEQISNQYSFSATASGGSSSSLNLFGNLSEFSDRYNNTSDRILTLELNGSKQLSERHQVGVGAGYTRYPTYSGLSGGVMYGGNLSEQIQISTNLSGQNTSTASYTNHSYGLSQSVRIFQDNHLKYGLSFNSGTGTSIYSSSNNGSKISSFNWATSANVEHQRSIGIIGFANFLSIQYGARQYRYRYSFMGVNVSNTLHSSIGGWGIEGTYNFYSQYNKSSVAWYLMGNSANIAVSGKLPENINSRTTINYNDNHNGGAVEAIDNQRSLSANQSFDASYYYQIPFTLSLSGSVHWYFLHLQGRTYGWQARFGSPNFFVRGLRVSYSYDRHFDPYYHKENAEHNFVLTYQWRALSFELTARQLRFIDRTRDVVFTVSRPF